MVHTRSKSDLHLHRLQRPLSCQNWCIGQIKTAHCETHKSPFSECFRKENLCEQGIFFKDNPLCVHFMFQTNNIRSFEVHFPLNLSSFPKFMRFVWSTVYLLTPSQDVLVYTQSVHSTRTRLKAKYRYSKLSKLVHKWKTPELI